MHHNPVAPLACGQAMDVPDMMLNFVLIGFQAGWTGGSCPCRENVDTGCDEVSLERCVIEKADIWVYGYFGHITWLMGSDQTVTMYNDIF